MRQVSVATEATFQHIYKPLSPNSDKCF